MPRTYIMKFALERRIWPRKDTVMSKDGKSSGDGKCWEDRELSKDGEKGKMGSALITH